MISVTVKPNNKCTENHGFYFAIPVAAVIAQVTIIGRYFILRAASK